MKTVKITRRSRIGFGWNTNPTGNGTEINKTTSPDIVGTVRTVIAKKHTDRVYRSLQSCYKTTGWFVRISGKWEKIKPASCTIGDVENTLGQLCNEHYEDKGRYMADSVTVALFD
jgi:hypothetical protein